MLNLDKPQASGLVDMLHIPTISAAVTFLSPEDGGRSRDAHDSPDYRPHIVIGDPSQRVALVDGAGLGVEHYLGVQFTGDGRELPAGREHHVTLSLVYFRDVDYSAVVPDATFTVREGGRIVGFGRVTRGLRLKTEA